MLSASFLASSRLGAVQPARVELPPAACWWVTCIDQPATPIKVICRMTTSQPFPCTRLYRINCVGICSQTAGVKVYRNNVAKQQKLLSSGSGTITSLLSLWPSLHVVLEGSHVGLLPDSFLVWFDPLSTQTFRYTNRQNYRWLVERRYKVGRYTNAGQIRGLVNWCVNSDQASTLSDLFLVFRGNPSPNVFP
jgi:hypothetical protein